MQRNVLTGILLTLVCLLSLSGVAQAQSQFTGLVKDESGAVLPGVTVEAASPALIEKSKTVVTDSNGRYTIVDLRQGTYKITFILAGFSTVAFSDSRDHHIFAGAGQLLCDWSSG